LQSFAFRECSRADLMTSHDLMTATKTISQAPASHSPPCFLFLSFGGIHFYPLSKLNQLLIYLSECQNPCKGGDGHLRPGRGGQVGTAKWGHLLGPLSALDCGSVQPNSWCSAFSQTGAWKQSDRSCLFIQIW